MLCPRCRIRTVPLDEQGIMATQCSQCHGIWVSKIALDRLTRREASQPEGVLTAGGPSLPDLAAQVAESNSTAGLECPYCAVAMEKERFHPMIPVQIDRCPKCDYIWLDAGEQDLLLRLYRDMMTDDDPDIAQKRGKLAQLDTMRANMPAAIGSGVDDEFNRTASITNSAVNTGLNIVGDLGRRNAGLNVAVDVAQFLVNLLVR